LTVQFLGISSLPKLTDKQKILQETRIAKEKAKALEEKRLAEEKAKHAEQEKIKAKEWNGSMILGVPMISCTCFFDSPIFNWLMLRRFNTVP
jgi:hypothetical protein